MGKDKGKGTMTRRPARIHTSAQITKDGRQYRIEGSLSLGPTLTVYLDEIREVRTWLGSDVPLSEGLIYRAGAESEIRTSEPIRDFDEAEEVLRKAAMRMLTFHEGKPIPVRHPIWRHAIAASVAAVLFATATGFTVPQTRPYISGALTWMMNELIEPGLAKSVHKPKGKNHKHANSRH
jgi:hypothetical protein